MREAPHQDTLLRRHEGGGQGEGAPRSSSRHAADTMKG